MLGIDRHALKVAWTVFLFGLLLALLYFLRGTLVTFTLALFLALLLAPVVTLVEHFTPPRVPRTAALAIVYIALIAILAAILVPLISSAVSDARTLSDKLPAGLSSDPLARLPLPAALEPARERISKAIHDRIEEIGQNAIPLAGKALGRLATGVGTVAQGVLVPILAFFLLKDGRTIYIQFILHFGGTNTDTLTDIYADLRSLLAQYVRSLVILSGATFVSYLLFLAITGAPYATLLAGTAAVLEFIPAVGPLVAVITILLVTLVSGYTKWLLMLGFFVVYRIFQDYFLAPLMMSSGVSIHPIMVLFGVLAGAELAGVAGVFFSIPVMAAIRVIFMRLEHNRKAAAAQAQRQP